MTDPVFPEGSLSGGKYTWWATRRDFSKEHLRALLRMVGEFDASAPNLLDLLGAHLSELTTSERAYDALKLIHVMAQGELDIDAWTRRMGSVRQQGKQHSRPVVSGEFAQDLNRDKYTRWAAACEMSEDFLRCLLWMVGEFGARSHAVLRFLNSRQAELAEHQRAVVALEAMSLMWEGEWFDADELARRIERGRARLEFNDLPQALRAALQRTALQVEWDSVRVTPDGYLLWGKGPNGRHVAAEAPRVGEVSVRTDVRESELPGAIIANVKTRAPGIRILTAQSVGPALGTVRGYVVTVEFELYGHRTLTLTYDADGREVTE